MLSSILLSIRDFFSREQLCVNVTFLFRRHLKIFNVEVSCIFGSVILLVLIPEKFNVVFLNLIIFIFSFFFNFCILPSNNTKLISSFPKCPYFAIIVEVSDSSGNLKHKGNYNAIDLCGFDVAERPQFPKSGVFRFVSGEISDVEGEFDLITLSHSMQYIKDIVCLFEQINRLLKPCGKVFVQVPNYSLKPCSLLLGDLFYHYSELNIL